MALLKVGAAVRTPSQVNLPLKPRGLLITAGDTTLTMTEWAKRLGFSHEALRKRVRTCIEHDLDLSLAVTTPRQKPWSFVK